MSAQADVQLSNFKGLFSLEGKVAVVTGGSRGLGLHAASGYTTPTLPTQSTTLTHSTSLLQAGCSKVFITSRKAKACEEACDALNALGCNGKAISVPADQAKTPEIERLVKEVEKHTDHVDILFANAGATWGAPFDEHPEAAFAKVMDLNVKSVFMCTQKYVHPPYTVSRASCWHSVLTNISRFAPLLRKRATLEDPSRIVITASIAGIGVGSLGANATFGYSASKAAALHLARNLAVELGPQHILTTSIAPGFFPTKMASGLMELTGGVKELAAANPNKRLGMPEDIAGTVVYLCSRAGSHVNGGHIVLDGGAVNGNSRL